MSKIQGSKNLTRSTKKGAVIVGVDKVGRLPPLSGAAAGAEKFRDWALSQGFEVKLLTDRKKKVRVSDVFSAVENFVSKKTYSQLVIYFSGHGFLRSPDWEVWLLSGAPDNPNEAINLSGSITASRGSGIRHIVFVSDACRSIPESFGSSQLSPGNIFPSIKPITPLPEVDVFYATIPGDPAYEAKINDSILRQSVFTSCMLDGLNGKDKRIISEINEPPRKLVVKPIDLKFYLNEIVPKKIAGVSVRLNQEPDIRIESRDPKYLSEIKKSEVIDLPSKNPNQLLSANHKNDTQFPKELGFVNDLSKINDRISYPRAGSLHARPPSPTDFLRMLSKSGGGIKEKNFVTNLKSILEFNLVDDFRLLTGFQIIGFIIKNAFVVNGKLNKVSAKDRFQFEVSDYRKGEGITAVIELPNGDSVPLAIFEGFVASVFLKKGKVLTVSYTPTKKSKYFNSKWDVLDRRVLAAVAAENARNGIHFKNPLITSHHLRRTFDPALGLFASYSFLQKGKFKDIKSVYKYMDSHHHWIFDVSLLAGKLPDKKSKNFLRVSPFCPMLSQGWAYLDKKFDNLPPLVQEASKYLKPALWTTFNRDGTKILKKMINK